MAALDTVNYAIRPNKNIERKVVFEALSYLEADFPFAAYRYVGFGSLWFSDFVLAHQSLGISDLISIQKGQALAARARFNAPYGCIKVIEGEFGALLSSLKLDERPAILWLDYESRIGAVLEELALTCERLPSGSV